MPAAASLWRRAGQTGRAGCVVSLTGSISRLAEYYRRHGAAATIHRAVAAVKRAVFAGRMVVFYCDLDNRATTQASSPAGWRVLKLNAYAELTQDQAAQITEFWNPKLAYKSINERFAKGASLWLVECEGRLAAYGWTLRGSTMEPYYFPLASTDVHLFDFHVFPPYRGRGINPFLVGHILFTLAAQRQGRAFIEAGEWNEAQLASLQKTPFRRYGLVRSYTICGRTFVAWTGKRPVLPDAKSADSNGSSLRMTEPSGP